MTLVSTAIESGILINIQHKKLFDYVIFIIFISVKLNWRYGEQMTIGKIVLR